MLLPLLLVFLQFTDFLCAAPPSPTGPRAQFREQHATLHEAFLQKLSTLAVQCERDGLTVVAQVVRELAIPFEQQAGDVDTLPETRIPPLDPSLPPAEMQCRSELRKAQTEYAQELYLLSRRALQAELVTETFAYLREAAFQNPDHEMARKALGYVSFEDRWMTPYALLKHRQGEVWHKTFGWILRRDVPRYEAGQRLYRSAWLSAEKEATLRSSFDQAWEIESEHFLLKTNTSLERGVELVTALEDFHRFFLREYALLFNTKQQVQNLFSSNTSSRSKSKKHTVYYYRLQSEYVQALSKKQPGVEHSNGIYMPNDRIAYFFENSQEPEVSQETMYHEVTHQLLSESSTSNFPIADDRDFWIVEGFACYMESFSRRDGRLTVGSPHHIRVYSAKHRIVSENWIVPFAKLMAMGKREFQLGAENFETLQKTYSQSTGMAHFFMHYEDGLYRDDLLAYLGQLYSPDRRVRERPRTLSELTGVSVELLQEQYVTYLSNLDSQPVLSHPAPTVKESP